jgi:hypothetical protein
MQAKTKTLPAEKAKGPVEEWEHELPLSSNVAPVQQLLLAAVA